MSDDHFLSRWSRRKHEAKRAPEKRPPEEEAKPAAPAAPAATPSVSGEGAPPTAPLPPVESLTPESDFSPFMRAEVDPSMRRQALKTLFSDPRFNVMDGLDVYIDDYSKPDPLPAGWLEKMYQATRLGDFRVQEQQVSEQATEGAETGELAEKAAEEQRLAQSPDANSADTPIKDSTPRESGKT